jgi:hypothetical protein
MHCRAWVALRSAQHHPVYAVSIIGASAVSWLLQCAVTDCLQAHVISNIRYDHCTHCHGTRCPSMSDMSWAADVPRPSAARSSLRPDWPARHQCRAVLCAILWHYRHCTTPGAVASSPASRQLPYQRPQAAATVARGGAQCLLHEAQSLQQRRWPPLQTLFDHARWSMHRHMASCITRDETVGTCCVANIAGRQAAQRVQGLKVDHRLRLLTVTVENKRGGHDKQCRAC